MEQQKQEPEIRVTLGFVNELIGYLKGQPYEEVFQFIGQLHTLGQEQLGQKPEEDTNES